MGDDGGTSTHYYADHGSAELELEHSKGKRLARDGAVDYDGDRVEVHGGFSRY